MEREKEDGLMPGLPDDIALSCITRVPRIHHASMAAVNTKWRTLLLDPNSIFQQVREERALTDQSLLLLADAGTHGHINCLEIDLATGKRCRSTSPNANSSAEILTEGHACVSIGSAVLVLGGYGAPPEREPSKLLHILDTKRRRWTRGAEMITGRGDFAWGIIAGQLFVASGFAGAAVGNTACAELYDFEMNEWRPVAPMPVAVAVDVFFVLSGGLFVRGWLPGNDELVAFSYWPEGDCWRDEPWMLCMLSNADPLTTTGFAVTSEDEIVFSAEILDCSVAWVSEPAEGPTFVIVKRYEANRDAWVRVCRIPESSSRCPCACASEDRDVSVHGLKRSVAVLCHGSPHRPEGELSYIGGGVLKVSVTCPTDWSSVLVDA
eukprot:TRINITY_DN35302_c0_g1_i1.p1 TRINITY_DN35302_c0_g1~~TRINITY_DN35302_c0_g1_i1.p1  ORF type:complete len:379 (+),score=-23.25 TRINITY_DN35302_c0_g1_i1:140-1276(+)